MGCRKTGNKREREPRLGCHFVQASHQKKRHSKHSGAPRRRKWEGKRRFHGDGIDFHFTPSSREPPEHALTCAAPPRTRDHATQKAFAQSDGHVKHMSSAPKPSELTELNSITESYCKQQTYNLFKQILRQTLLQKRSKTSLSWFGGLDKL